jgi:DMSO/TMAO reductase YedYZ molybdopterin-dependent catalytic subunit
MSQKTRRFRTVGDGTGLDRSGTFTREELALALRNHGMPLEGLRYPLTPTGMHYVLVHFDVPYVDADTARLKIGGLVARRMTLSLSDIKGRPAITMPVTMECAGNGRAFMAPRSVSQPWMGEAIGTAEWTGTPLAPILEEAGLSAETVDLVFTGSDQGVQGDEVQFYQRSLSVADATRDEVLLVYEMNGRPLEPQHGFPLRLLVPGWYGMTSVKWLTSIEAIDHQFEGYQQIDAYRYSQDADDPGEPVSLIRPRAMMIPPGIPDFLTRTRLLGSGAVTLTGRAWAGRENVLRVEVSTDDGQTWEDARLGQPAGAFAWYEWQCDWNATPGTYTLSVRATDSASALQPDEVWNVQGVGNNARLRIDVIVEETIG